MNRVERLAREYAEYGINPHDEKYHRPPQTWPDYNQPLCRWCYGHRMDRPRFYCDLQLAKAERIYAEGNSVGECCRCHAAMPSEKPEGKVWARTQEVCRHCDHPPPTRHKPEIIGGYRADGHGCVEKVHPTELALMAREGGLGE